MDFNKVHIIYFLGIGGIGMSALARYFIDAGKEIYGYDLTPSPLTQQLEKEGMKIHFEEDVENIPAGIDLVIYTPAVPQSHAEYVYFEENNIPILKRAEVIGLLSQHHFTIAVGGTHGKTSICALTAHLLKHAGIKVTAFVGGIMKNYSSNLILSHNADYLLVEADEFDRSFLQIKPNIALISSTDADHLDIYGHHDELTSNFKLFAGNVSDDGLLIFNDKLEAFDSIQATKYNYGLKDNTTYKAENVRIVNGQFMFDLVTPSISVTDIIMTVPGLHYVENAVAAASIALQLGVSGGDIKDALSCFKGVERRFEFRINQSDKVYIDDYAHHPEEINATVEAAKSLFPTRKITGIFQPHLYSRTRDFAKEFAEALDKLDEVILLDIYPAREKAIPGITSDIILSGINKTTKKILSKEQALQYVKDAQPEVLLTMGAGDIGLMAEDIETLLKTL